MKQRGFEFSVRWSNPYTQPPDNQPRILLRAFAESSRPVPEDIDALHKRLGLGSGWCVSVACIEPPPRRKNAGQKASLRVKALERRVGRHIGPLFAQEVIDQQLEARPDYFQGGEVSETSAEYIRQSDQRDAEQWAAYQQWLGQQGGAGAGPGAVLAAGAAGGVGRAGPEQEGVSVRDFPAERLPWPT